MIGVLGVLGVLGVYGVLEGSLVGVITSAAPPMCPCACVLVHEHVYLFASYFS